MLWTGIICAAGIGGLSLVSCRYVVLWLEAYFSGADIRLLSLIRMSLKGVDARVIVRAKVKAAQGGLPSVSTDEMEALYLAGGNVHLVMLALISAHRAKIDLNWSTAAAIDLAGRDVCEAVRVSVSPKAIHCPAQTTTELRSFHGIAKDGIQLKVRVLVTARTNFSLLIGGATESTLIARVGQAVVSSIGACDTYQQVLANPSLIACEVLTMGLDSQTSFSIVSVDIADIDIGANVGAKLRLDRANAEIRMACAFAEERRAMALAWQQEAVALTREYQAQLILAGARIPPAIAAAFRVGQLRSSGSHGEFKNGRPDVSALSNREQPDPRAAAQAEITGQVAAWESDGGRSEVPREADRVADDVRMAHPPTTSHCVNIGES